VKLCVSCVCVVCMCVVCVWCVCVVYVEGVCVWCVLGVSHPWGGTSSSSSSSSSRIAVVDEVGDGRGEGKVLSLFGVLWRLAVLVVVGLVVWLCW